MQYLIFFGQIILAGILGALIGWQRHTRGKAAGVRTYALVTIGSAIFTLISVNGFGTEPARVASQILTGIGFIGAGTIIHKSGGVEGLTTAAGLWAISGIGMAVGVGWYVEAIIASLVIFGVLMLHEEQ